MKGVKGTSGLVLFDSSIEGLSLVAARSFDHDLPFSLELDRAEWRMTLNEAERLASAGRRIEDRLDRAARQGVAPRAEPLFRRKIDFGDEVVTLELGIAAEPVGVYLEWAGKRVVVSLDRRNVLLIALARIGEDAADIRRASGPPRPRYNVNVR